jgi:hypothetical protein
MILENVFVSFGTLLTGSPFNLYTVLSLIGFILVFYFGCYWTKVLKPSKNSCLLILSSPLVSSVFSQSFHLLFSWATYSFWAWVCSPYKLAKLLVGRINWNSSSSIVPSPFLSNRLNALERFYFVIRAFWSKELVMNS